MIVFFIYSTVIAPFKMGFLTKVPYLWQKWDNIVDTVIVIDIVMTCFTAFKDKDDVVIDSPCAIFCSYLKSWLLLDILAVFPFDLVIKSDPN